MSRSILGSLLMKYHATVTAAMIAIAIMGFQIFTKQTKPAPTPNAERIQLLVGRWIDWENRTELTLEQVESHNTIPRKLFNAGSEGQQLLLILPESGIASSDDILSYWKGQVKKTTKVKPEKVLAWVRSSQ